MKAYLLMTILLYSTGCSVVEKKYDNIAVQKNYREINDENTSIVATNAALTQTSNISKNHLNRLDKQSLNINGVKMRVAKIPLGMGSSVFNTQINSWGVIKGSMTVVMYVKDSVHQLNKGAIFNLKKIAKNTYQFSPTDNTVDLYELYKNLLNNALVKVVELDIFYDGAVAVQDM
ncbi:MAG: hypothetical protein ACI8R9_000763 [Paraglaciecola sp.]|jgi:hypothetical protein